MKKITISLKHATVQQSIDQAKRSLKPVTISEAVKNAVQDMKFQAGALKSATDDVQEANRYDPD